MGYLLHVLRNTFLNQRRSESRRPRFDPLRDELDLIADPKAAQPDAVLEVGEVYALLFGKSLGELRGRCDPRLERGRAGAGDPSATAASSAIS